MFSVLVNGLIRDLILSWGFRVDVRFEEINGDDLCGFYFVFFYFIIKLCFC